MRGGTLRAAALATGLGAMALAAPGPAGAHDGVDHGTEAEAKAHLAETDRAKAAAAGADAADRPEGAEGAAKAPPAALPFPVEIRARFALTDHTGRQVTEADFAGTPMAIFFGYANCEAICSVALPRLGQALDLLGEDADGLAPLVITVDPARDTVATMGPALAKWHPRLIGLTGSDAALAAARAAFQVESKAIGEDLDGQPIYAHGSFIYLIGPDGKVATLLPPILGPERMAEIIRSHL